MAAKIQIKSDRINSLGGFFFIIDHFRSSGLAALVDKTLGIKGSTDYHFCSADTVGCYLIYRFAFFPFFQ